MTELKVGDVVRLKSGGPKMTVESTGDDRGYLCAWFRLEQDDDKCHWEHFKPEALEKEEAK